MDEDMGFFALVYPLDRSTTAKGCARPAETTATRATMRDVALTRWDPLRDLLALHEHLGQLVGTDAPGWTPPVDLYETASEFVLTAERPGLKRDRIEIHVEDNRVVIRGERGEAPCEQYHRVERGHGR